MTSSSCYELDVVVEGEPDLCDQRLGKHSVEMVAQGKE